jgi:hypothetical protein
MLVHWHGSTLLFVPTLVGDGLCAALSAFGDVTGRHTMPHLFWWILWLAQVPLGVQMALGLALLAGGARPSTPYHFMYAGLIILTLAGLHGLRPGGWLRRAFVVEARYRESRWLLLLCLFLGGLVARAYVTGLGAR